MFPSSWSRLLYPDVLYTLVNANITLHALSVSVDYITTMSSVVAGSCLLQEREHTTSLQADESGKPTSRSMDKLAVAELVKNSVSLTMPEGKSKSSLTKLLNPFP